ncbi:MAG: hypothetical protein AAF333_01105 [Planctomycetota bacterium]
MIERLWSQYGLLALWLTLIGLALFVGVKASRGFAEARELEDRLAAVAEQLRPVSALNDDDVKPRTNASNADGPAAEALARLNQRCLFMPAPPQGFRNVQGVLGDRVLYPGGQSFGLGDNAMGATIVAIGTNWVELEHEGQTITLDIFNGSERGPERLRLAEPSGDTPPGDAVADEPTEVTTDAMSADLPDAELSPEQIELLQQGFPSY